MYISYQTSININRINRTQPCRRLHLDVVLPGRELKLLLHTAAIALDIGSPLCFSVLFNGQHKGSILAGALRKGELEHDRSLFGKGQLF